MSNKSVTLYDLDKERQKNNTRVPPWRNSDSLIGTTVKVDYTTTASSLTVTEFRPAPAPTGEAAKLSHMKKRQETAQEFIERREHVAEDLFLQLINNGGLYHTIQPMIQNSFENLKHALRREMRVAMQKPGRDYSPDAVEAFLYDEDMQESALQSVIRYYLNDELQQAAKASKSPQPIQQSPEIKMKPQKSAPIVERQVLVSGENIAELSEDELIDRIAKAQAGKAALEKLNSKSTKIGKNIKEFEEAVGILETELDSRE